MNLSMILFSIEVLIARRGTCTKNDQELSVGCVRNEVFPGLALLLMRWDPGPTTSRSAKSRHLGCGSGAQRREISMVHRLGQSLISVYSKAIHCCFSFPDSATNKPSTHLATWDAGDFSTRSITACHPTAIVERRAASPVALALFESP